MRVHAFVPFPTAADDSRFRSDFPSRVADLVACLSRDVWKLGDTNCMSKTGANIRS